MVNGHFIKKCEFGKSHGTCRCPSRDKKIIQVPCDRPNVHGPKPVDILGDLLGISKKSKPQTLRERMAETLGEAFSDLIAEAKYEAILDALEEDVKGWLSDGVKELFNE